MAICKHCGVEFDSALLHCPLCDTPEGQDYKERSTSTQLKYNPGYEPLSPRERGRLFWEISGIFHFSALVVVFLIDLLVSQEISWSLFVMTSLLASFIYITLVVFTIRKLSLFLPGLLFNTAGLLVLIDYFDGGINWFFSGLPMAGSFVILLGVVLIFSYRAKDKGFNLIAFAALAMGIFCISVEVIIQLGLHQRISLKWSLITAAALLPFALILLFFHYRLKRGTSLRKFFHL